MFGSCLGWKVPWPLLATRVVKFRFISLHMYGAEQYYQTDANLIFNKKGKSCTSYINNIIFGINGSMRV